MSQLRRDLLRSLEAGIVGLFFVQAVRFVYATLYARASSADLVGRTTNPTALLDAPGVVESATVRTEVLTLGILLLLPLLALLISRWRASFSLAVLLVALGRSMALQTADLQVPGAALVIGAGLLYLALIIIRRPSYFPAVLLLGFTGDQIVRILGDTYDHTWQRGYTLDIAGRVDLQMDLLIPLVSLALIVLTLIVWAVDAREPKPESDAPPQRGMLNLWGGIALGAALFLEFTVLGLPNVIARWSDTSYASIVPWLLAATALPLVPEVRDLARRFAGMFDGVYRGWLWALLLALLLVVGRRYDGLPAGIALVFAQFLVGLTLWWLIQVGTFRVNLTGLMVILAALVFGGLAVGDYFSYDYAYVRDFSAPYDQLSEFLRSFRGTGLALALIAALLVSIPIILARRRIPWRGGPVMVTLLTLVMVIAVSVGGAAIAAPEAVRRPVSADCFRVATYNIHGGYSQFFDPNLERVADLIELDGADVVLLQEIETGRMASFGVDQVYWLAQRLHMEATFFPQNEALQGLAVLSRVPIDSTESLLLPSDGNQAAAMHVILDPEALANDPNAAGIGGLHLYNVWLSFRVAERSGAVIAEADQDQNRQMDSLLAWIAQEHGPNWTDRILLGGTFNYGPDSPQYKRLRMEELENPAIQDPFAGLRTESAATLSLVDGTSARYDYLWVFNLPTVGTIIDNSPEAVHASDHRPAIVAVGRRQGVTCQP
ncbi:endonuclease/exonuclease/phosphatase family protein [Aggregatilinea lenta]|uniref:endonuclease/exonuclease/phosphatase family protein n=1 Tax=Aggregatilinea lenta TaxID=913108 RepID=UPI000E5BB558|nr:endonuclease/exonuclease/phosphatase family protein [Aggregatilinea lenta]